MLPVVAPEVARTLKATPKLQVAREVAGNSCHALHRSAIARAAGEEKERAEGVGASGR